MDIGGGSAFALMIPVLAGFIAMSIADRPGFAPGMVGGFMAANGGAGFLGGLIAGFLAGYLVVGLKNGLVVYHNRLRELNRFFFIRYLGYCLQDSL